MRFNLSLGHHAANRLYAPFIVDPEIIVDRIDELIPQELAIHSRDAQRVGCRCSLGMRRSGKRPRRRRRITQKRPEAIRIPRVMAARGKRERRREKNDGYRSMIQCASQKRLRGTGSKVSVKRADEVNQMIASVGRRMAALSWAH